MVRFSDIIKTDNQSIRKILGSERDHRTEEPLEVDNKAAGASDAQSTESRPSADTVNAEIRTLYNQLLDIAVEIRERVTKNQEIRPSPVIAIFRNIINDNIVEELFTYATSVQDEFGSPSHIVSVTLAHLKMGKEMGYENTRLLKSGLTALLHSADMDELPDHILEENVLSPDDIAAIRKHPWPALDMLVHFSTKASGISPTITRDIELPLALPVLGTIPHEDEEGIRKSMENEGRRITSDSYLLQSMNFVSHFAHKSALAGSFRALRTNLLFLGLGEKIKTLAVTSLFQGEGKTTVSANLGITLAQAGMKTLIAGTELKKPSVAKSANAEISPGLTNVIADNYLWRDAIKTLPDVMPQDEEMVLPELDNLHIITNGNAPLQPDQPIDSKRLIHFIKETKKEYDIVIFDTSPSLSFTGPLVLGPRVDAVLLVSRKNCISGDLEEKAAQLLKQNDNIMGMVLNDVKETGDKGILLHVNNTGLEQEATEKMGESDDAYKELAKIAAEKKTGPFRLLLGMIVLAVIVTLALWLGGILSFDMARKTKQVAQKEHEPVLHKKTITQSIKVPEPTTSSQKEASPIPDKKTTPEVEKGALPAPLPLESTGKTTKVSGPEKPVPSSPPMALESPQDVSNAKVSYPYSLHMGSHKTIQLANQSIDDLKVKGLFPFWTRVDLGKKGEWFRVFVGSFKDADEADTFQKSHGIKADRILKTAYAVQIGLYRSKEEGNQMVSKLKEAGHFPYYIEQPQNQYQLLVGAFQTRKAAESLAARLKESGLDCEMILR